MKKQVVAGLMVAVAMVSFGCSGRNAEFGVVDMKAVESKAEIVKTVKEEVATKGKALQEEMDQAATDLQNLLYTIPNVPYDSVPEV